MLKSQTCEATNFSNRVRFIKKIYRVTERIEVVILRSCRGVFEICFFSSCPMVIIIMSHGIEKKVQKSGPIFRPP